MNEIRIARIINEKKVNKEGSPRLKWEEELRSVIGN